MKRWNGLLQSLRTIDPALLEEACSGSSHCLRCHRQLPQGVGRAYCLDHSDYAQAVIRRVKARRRKTAAA
jgi:hypothetical protein